MLLRLSAILLVRPLEAVITLGLISFILEDDKALISDGLHFLGGFQLLKRMDWSLAGKVRDVFIG